jgi:transcriptional antiterminator NusG
MAKNWYIIHTFSGFENKVLTAIEKTVKSKFPSAVGDIKIPMEDVVEMRAGKKRNVKKKIFPGYLLIELDLEHPDYEWKQVVSKIRTINGITGFLGSDNKKEIPRPITTEDAKNILMKMGEIKSSDVIIPKVTFTYGETVKVVDGPFTNFNGVVEEINHEKGKVKVTVEIFGRATPVELDFLQVEKI